MRLLNEKLSFCRLESESSRRKAIVCVASLGTISASLPLLFGHIGGSEGSSVLHAVAGFGAGLSFVSLIAVVRAKRNAL